jgi:predicted ATP-grasp superfamily ATP-dependent carboligase
MSSVTVLGNAPPVAVVLACGGADEGPLGVVRSLGLEGIVCVLITESPETPAASSRYVRLVVHVPEFTSRPDKLLEAIELVAARFGRPLLYPTADPDLLLVTRFEDMFRPCCEVVAPPHSVVSELSDKRRFATFAESHGLKVPRTYCAVDAQSIARICAMAMLPVVVKPSMPQSWQIPQLGPVTGHAKAIMVQTRAELEGLCRAIGEFTFEFLVQEYVPGDDHEHVDVHAYLTKDSTPLAWFCGRKLRICPPHAGSGCFVVSEQNQTVIELALDTLKRIGYQGIANLNFKRNPETGQFWLLEINPRVSQWNVLAARCGVNLPYVAYLDAVGRRQPVMSPPRQLDGIHYLNFRNDRRAVGVYRQEGVLTVRDYLRSLLARPIVYQVFDRKDIRPFIDHVRRLVTTRLGRRLRALIAS